MRDEEGYQLRADGHERYEICEKAVCQRAVDGCGGGL